MIFIQISHKALRYSPVMPDNHFSFPVIFKGKIIPVGMWCQNDVVSTSMRHHVASTLTRRHFYVTSPLEQYSF